MKIYKKAHDLFRKKFSIPTEYEIIFFSGSGTLAIESFISHFKGKLAVLSDDFENEKFASRWKDMAAHYGKYDENSPHKIYVQLETSQSKYNGEKDVVLTDAISAFPFFPTPKSPAWVTVSSKLIGGMPVLGVLAIKKDFMNKFLRGDGPSYLNPFLYTKFQAVNQTPFTPAMPLFEDLCSSLEKLNVAKLRREIVERYSLFVQALGRENIIGDTLGPVITLKNNVLSKKLAQKWNLYGHSSNGRIQIFLYSESDKFYRQLAKDISKELSAGGKTETKKQNGKPAFKKPDAINDLVVIDIDMTIADNRKRLIDNFLPGVGIKYASFFNRKAMMADTPMAGAKKAVQFLQKNNYGIVFLSARPKNTFDATAAWLEKHGLKRETDRIILVDKQEDKLKVLRDLSPVLLYVDDLRYDYQSGNSKLVQGFPETIKAMNVPLVIFDNNWDHIIKKYFTVAP